MTLAKLETVDSEAGLSALTVDDLTLIRRQLIDSQNILRETFDRLRQSQEEKDMVVRRKEELEERVSNLAAEYEELLGLSQSPRPATLLAEIFRYLQRRPLTATT